MPPEPLAEFMVEHGYVGRGVPVWRRLPHHPQRRTLSHELGRP